MIDVTSQCETVHNNSMGKKESILFLINPKSGVSRKKQIPQMVEKYIDHERYDVDICYTQYAGHAYELAKDAVARAVDVVVAVGGDGTVNEVGRALVHSETALAVIPCGSGNGFARHLGIPVDTKRSIAFINKAEPMFVDYGKINGHPFFCSCGMGFDAIVSNDFANSSNRGVFNYIKQSLVDWVTYKPETYYVETDYVKQKVKAFVIACGNASQYGNNAYITPFASMRDGLITVSLLSPFNAFEVPLMATYLFTHTFNECSRMTTVAASWVRIRREKPGPVHYDGEPCLMDKELFVEMIPNGIKVMAVPGWDGTCVPVPLYRQFYEMFAGSLLDISQIEIGNK
ncbi:MAG: YegS/Rv2252/BmrU family lipid kinase [Bacteroidaceae bacterium]|nr:YegS/Rv2252/BmrU family lipid kinase [Bacteroidaceae bacterium]